MFIRSSRSVCLCVAFTMEHFPVFLELRHQKIKLMQSQRHLNALLYVQPELYVMSLTIADILIKGIVLFSFVFFNSFDKVVHGYTSDI